MSQQDCGTNKMCLLIFMQNDDLPLFGFGWTIIKLYQKTFEFM